MARTRPDLVIVGGFLGSGKTTLLLRAAAYLRQQGLRAAVITNDQGGALVDTKLASASAFETEEVAGGCYCCRFSDFIGAAERLLEHEPDVIFTEPVGSCLDISATVLQPLKHHYGDRFRLAPFTVLVDPQRAKELLAPDADPQLAYLFRNQIDEADLVCFTKADLYPEAANSGLHLSAKTGEGVAEWLHEVLAGGRSAGGRLLQLDYARYAEAEAALGWLNWQADLRLKAPLSPACVVGPLLDRLDEALTKAGITIAHLKAFDQAPTGYIKASVCRNGEEPEVEGDLDASPAARHELVLNLRARSAPERLEAAVKEAAGALPGRVDILRFECFRPAAPKPERLYTIND